MQTKAVLRGFNTIYQCSACESVPELRVIKCEGQGGVSAHRGRWFQLGQGITATVVQ